MAKIRVLAIGDVVGEPGRRICTNLLANLRKRENINFVLANGENIAGGSGVTERTAKELFSAGVDVITSGDHVFNRKEAFEFLAREPRVLRPANFPSGVMGLGSNIFTMAGGEKIGVINLLGRVFLKTLDCPFRKADELIEKMSKETNLILVDMHAEATSEKMALGWFLDGRVSAIFGTHTHIQTADETILPKGTAYITELGMTGPYRSILGRDIEAVLRRFIDQVPVHFDVASQDIRLTGVMVEIDSVAGKAISINRVQEKLEITN